MFKHHILMITHDYIVYQVPKSNFENSYGQMLFNITGEPIEKKWPQFQDPKWNWTNLKKDVRVVWHVDKVMPYIYFMPTNNAVSSLVQLKLCIAKY